LDLERDSHLRQLQDPEAFFRSTRGQLVCLDEVQRRPDLLPLLRSELDDRAGNGPFLLLGSASPDLMRQTTESLAGRVGFIELTPFTAREQQTIVGCNLERWWVRGGFPRSLLAEDDAASLAWREDFIRTFLERDLVALRPRMQVSMMARLWRMCAHLHGQMLNASSLATSLGVSAPTVRDHIELLTGTFLLRLLPAFSGNLGKRLVKAPRLYLRDAGLLHALLGIPNHHALLGHPSYGPSWEGLVVEEIVGHLPTRIKASFYRTSAGAELDLVLEGSEGRLAIECKASAAPTVTAGFWNALTDTECSEAWIVAPVEHSYPLRPGIQVGRLEDVIADLERRGWREGGKPTGKMG
jgi:predicted AAA+ superfamily ATPase